MTISSEESPRIQYAGPISAGTTLSFPYSYIDKSQVKAQISDEDVWAIDVDYSVGDESITTISTVASGETLTLYRRTVLDQQASFPQNAKFNSEKINNALDKLTMQQQEQQEALGRSVKFSLDIDTSITDVTVPAPVAGKTMKWNDTETGLINSDYDPDEAIEITTAAAEDAAEDAAAAQVSATNAANSLATLNSTIGAAVSSATAAAQVSATNAANSLATLNSTIGAAVSSATAAAAASALSAQGYAEDADEAATRAEAAAGSLETVIVEPGDEGKFLQVASNYINGYVKKTPAEVLDDIGACDKNLSNLSLIGKATSTNLVMPNYSAIVNKTWNTTYTAECDGWIFVSAVSNNSVASNLAINSLVVWQNTSGTNGYINTGFIPIAKGSTYIATGGISSQVIKFIPAKGV